MQAARRGLHEFECGALAHNLAAGKARRHDGARTAEQLRPEGASQAHPDSERCVWLLVVPWHRASLHRLNPAPAPVHGQLMSLHSIEGTVTRCLQSCSYQHKLLQDLPGQSQLRAPARSGGVLSWGDPEWNLEFDEKTS